MYGKEKKTNVKKTIGLLGFNSLNGCKIFHQNKLTIVNSTCAGFLGKFKAAAFDVPHIKPHELP